MCTYVHVSVYIYALEIFYILHISHIIVMCSPKSVQYRIFLSDFTDALKPLLVIGGGHHSPIFYRLQWIKVVTVMA